jgi:putative membrane protein
MIAPSIQKNDKQAKILIFVVSFVVFAAVTFLTNFKPFEGVDMGFNVHVLSLVNAVINSAVSVLLIWALMAVKNKQYALHKKLMFGAMFLSILFLVSYIGHHLLAGETKYGGEHNVKYVIYLIILFSHIALATIILPFILFTAYRGLTGEFDKHKKLSKYTWPLWLYVSVTGVLVYWFISPYYTPQLF